MTKKIRDQIMAIRASGKYNMFDLISVQREAHERGFYELVLYIEEHRKEYAEFILTGVCNGNEKLH